MTVDIRDKEGVPIHVGDHVRARFRQGQVEAIFTDNTDVPAEKVEGHEIHVTVKHPPKVVFTDQKGNQVSHNPAAIVHEKLDERQIGAAATEIQSKKWDETDTKEETKSRKERGEDKEKEKTSAKENKSSTMTAPTAYATKTQTEKPKILGRDGLPIHAGDTVKTPYRGGVREGEVEAVFADKSGKPVEELPGHDVHVPIINPPKVVFTTQRDNQVSHNPTALSHTDVEGNIDLNNM